MVAKHQIQTTLNVTKLNLQINRLENQLKVERDTNRDKITG